MVEKSAGKVNFGKSRTRVTKVYFNFFSAHHSSYIHIFYRRSAFLLYLTKNYSTGNLCFLVNFNISNNLHQTVWNYFMILKQSLEYRKARHGGCSKLLCFNKWLWKKFKFAELLVVFLFSNLWHQQIQPVRIACRLHNLLCRGSAWIIKEKNWVRNLN